MATMANMESQTNNVMNGRRDEVIHCRTEDTIIQIEKHIADQAMLYLVHVVKNDDVVMECKWHKTDLPKPVQELLTWIEVQRVFTGRFCEKTFKMNDDKDCYISRKLCNDKYPIEFPMEVMQASEESTKILCKFLDNLKNNNPDKWCWWRIGNLSEDDTYVKEPYVKYDAILPEFENIKTIEDLFAAKLDFKSPTDCYFEYFAGRMFYHDSQGCLMWGLADGGEVFVTDGESPREFVAASLPEFLSRIDFENKASFL